ncbi:MAG: hypothetical protein RBS73_00405 [Prolixibacteraceae bacterium]|jgi:hypothetical protein|nr:hypothetical protein [Prolixibacteraceae bacterium]
MPTKHYLLTIALQLIALTLITGCIGTGDNSGGKTEKGQISDFSQYTAYKQLIAMYPEDNQGLGKEKIFPTTEHQPMTYGLVLTSEVLHFRATRGEESKRRIQKAVRWLLDNQDLDHDGKPGWGLPQAWDAFSDGAINPINQPYTITSAIVLNGLLESLALKDFWSDSECDEIFMVMAKVAVRWCSEIWSEGYSGGYFWYSPSPVDDIFAVNSPSLFTGNLARLLHDHPDAFTRQERRLVQSRVDGMARAIVATVELRQDLPFWDYRPGHDPKRANDVLHHIYTILGIEMYRDYGGRVKLPWTREQAIASVDQFWKDGQIMEFPQDIIYTGEQVRFNSARSSQWGAGSVVAAYAYWGEFEKAKQALETIQRDYGTWPHLQLSPGRKSDVFFPRDSSHVLWGQAVYLFCQ